MASDVMYARPRHLCAPRHLCQETSSMMMTSSMDGQRHLCGGERCEVAANFCGHLPERLGARILHFGNGFSVRVERLVFVPIVERKPVDIVDERLGRHAFGQDQR